MIQLFMLGSSMYIEKLEDAKNNVTTSRRGNKFSYESPIPGVHIYSDVWPESMEWFKGLDQDSYWEQHDLAGNIPWVREDYLDEDTGKRVRPVGFGMIKLLEQT